jgi:GNAT superfamily N-acetyltransferase
MGAGTVRPVAGKRDLRDFVDVAYRLNADDPNWVPNLRSEEIEKFTPGKNPFFAHARCQLFLARRDGKAVGRISAHIDELALSQPVEQGMGPGTGNWGALEAEDEQVARALIAVAEDWLRQQGMDRVLAPMNLSVWEEPGIQTKGFDHPPMVMMAHHDARYHGWIEALGYAPVKMLRTYALDIRNDFAPLIGRIVASGEANKRIRVRKVVLKDFEAEAALICDILNDAWSDNWGFVPFTPEEIAYTAKKLKPLVHPDLIRIAEYDGEPVAFMMTLPDLNKPLRKINRRSGRLSPLGMVRLLFWLKRPRHADMRVPLMGVRKHLQSSRLASQLAFMMIEYIRQAAIRKYQGVRGEIGWILEDNQGMVAIADALGTKVNREYAIYGKEIDSRS